MQKLGNMIIAVFNDSIPSFYGLFFLVFMISNTGKLSSFIVSKNLAEISSIYYLT